MAGFHGKFVWYELMTSDPAAAVNFYSSVFDWGARDAGVPNMSYTLMSAGKSDVGGVMETPESARAMGARPIWIGYVAVDDVDHSAAELKKAGGTIYKGPDDIPGVGRFAIVADPHHATIALFKGAGEMPSDLPPAGTLGHIGWHELYAGDREADFAFYSKLFGWTKSDALDMGPMGTYQIFAESGVAIGGMMTKPEAMPVASWTYYVNVANVDATLDKTKAAGGEVLNGPHEVPGGSWIVQCRDPQGAAFNFVGPRG